MNRKEQLALVTKLHACIARAAEATHTSADLLERLERVCAEQERQHRRFGSSLVGAAQVSREYRGFPVKDAVSCFVVVTVADGIGPSCNAWERQIGALYGLREDYQIAAILCGSPEFRARLGKAVADAFPGRATLEVLKQVREQTDYVALKGGDT
jgi:hypothetical protein